MDKVVVDIRILAVHLGKRFRFVNLQIKFQQYWGDWVCIFSLEQHIGCQIVVFENDHIAKSRCACLRLESVQFDVTRGSSMQLGFPLILVSRVFRKRFWCRVEEVEGVEFRGKKRVLNCLRRLIRLSEIQQLVMPVVLYTRLASCDACSFDVTWGSLTKLVFSCICDFEELIVRGFNGGLRGWMVRNRRIWYEI